MNATVRLMRKRKRRRNRFRLILQVLLLLAVGYGLYAANCWNLLPRRYYSASHFGIATVHSPVDFNGNGIDDYTDILLGAREDAKNKPRYDGAYQQGGYPPDNIGVCTDVIWRAFKRAGYSLKDMVDTDIARHGDLYPRAATPEPNIDFRRVPNLMVFFGRHAVSLTTDLAKVAEWQPGDIVIFGSNHIAIISDRRNADGIPYIIHNSGQPRREEDALARSQTPISGHFRFDASRLSALTLVSYVGP